MHVDSISRSERFVSMQIRYSIRHASSCVRFSGKCTSSSLPSHPFDTVPLSAFLSLVKACSRLYPYCNVNGMSKMAFAAPSALGPAFASTRATRCTRPTTSKTARVPLMARREGRNAPDYNAGWSPESDPQYVEVRVLSVAAHGRDGALITLSPVGGRRAFRMAVTRNAAQAIRSAASRAGGQRPGSLELAHNLLQSTGTLVTRAAITHVRADVFIARIWTRVSLSLPPDGINHHDAKPSDAIALALRAAAPLYLNVNLLAEWGVPVADVLRDARAGRCEILQVHSMAMSASTLRAQVTAAPEHVALAKLRAAMDLAVRLERFTEAARLRDAIAAICPAEALERQLEKALQEENFDEAAKLRDSVVLWRARQRRWERAGIDASIFQGGTLRNIIEAATKHGAPEKFTSSLYGIDINIDHGEDDTTTKDEHNEQGGAGWPNMERGLW